MPDTTAKPNNLQGAPKTSDKLIAMGTMALNTAPVLAAPALSAINPNLNPTNAGGIAVTLIGNGILVIIQGLAAFDWFDDYKWAVLAGIAIAVFVCGILYIVLLGNPELGILNSFGAMHQFATNYGPLHKLGVFSRPGDIPLPQEAQPLPDIVVNTEPTVQVGVQQ